jgi:hypothetical protein
MQVRFELKQRQLLKWMKFSIFNAFEHDIDQEFAQKVGYNLFSHSESLLFADFEYIE